MCECVCEFFLKGINEFIVNIASKLSIQTLLFGFLLMLYGSVAVAAVNALGDFTLNMSEFCLSDEEPLLFEFLRFFTFIVTFFHMCIHITSICLYVNSK